MQLSCPNCSAQYDSEAYPNVFEINCVCGYSILVPDLGAFENQNKAAKNENPSFESTVPTSMDAEDENLLIRPEGLMALNPENEQLQRKGGVLDMTPSEDLPSGLVYDPFELPQLDMPKEMAIESLPEDSPELDLGNQDAFAESAPLQSEKLKRPPIPVKNQASSETSSKTLVESQSKTQNLVNRSQLASIGNFVGSSYHIKIQDISVDDVEKIVIRVQKMLSDRPWLEAELRRRHLDLEKLKSDFELDSVPELLALEIYLAAFEFGGQCQFSENL